MWKSLISLALLSIALNYELEDGVFVLNGENFDQWMEEYADHLRLAEFYAPWCGHCKSLAPHYAEAAQRLKASGAKIVLAKIDATADENSALGTKFGVSGYPTLKLFKAKQSEPVDYDGPREADGIVSYLESKVFSLIELQKHDDLLNLRSDNPAKFVLVGFFPKDTPLKELLLNFQPDFEFAVAYGYYDEGDLKEMLGKYVFADEGIVLFAPMVVARAGSDLISVTADTAEKLNEMIKERVLEDVPIFDRAVQEALFTKSVAFGMYITDECHEVKHAKQIRYIYNRLKKAEMHITFRLGIACKEVVQGLVREVGKEDEDNFFIISDEKKTYLHDQPLYSNGKFDQEGLSAYLQKYMQGELQPHIKSQELENEYENDVRVLVGKNVDQVLEESRDKDVFLFLYASWCGHCKAVHPTIDELAGQYKGTNVVIAKMEATENYVPQAFEVQGFPTFYFIPAAGEPTKYEGGRELTDFKQYIDENAKSVKAEL